MTFNCPTHGELECDGAVVIGFGVQMAVCQLGRARTIQLPCGCRLTKPQFIAEWNAGLVIDPTRLPLDRDGHTVIGDETVSDGLRDIVAANKRTVSAEQN